jgi:hypothetical protein
MTEIETNEQRFQKMGIDRVRLLIITSGLPQQMMTDAIAWLAQRDEEERLRNDSAMELQMRVALSAKNAAWIAAITAIIAAIITIVVAFK